METFLANIFEELVLFTAVACIGIVLYDYWNS